MLDDKFYIESAAVSDEECGNPIYTPAKQCLTKHNIWFDPYKRARTITSEDYSKFDKIICMDNNNLCWLRRIIGEDNQNKIHLLMSYTGKNKDVADPWYTRDFETSYQDILKGCKSLLSKIENENDN